MAIIAMATDEVEVRGKGKALDATVNFSGALMEMLATVYANILMSAIRESLQNACDAARRAGLSFQEGVMLHMPTSANPMITIVDKGFGMTKEFMEADDGYLSFGTSTKSGDNGAAGGLGVGRWAAYGYIRECYITTCHESDMIERTYFQFQGPGNTPQVQLAAEHPGTTIGTKVSFPVKDTDIDEAHKAVGWLKSIMQLTMGDSFSVDAPALIPNSLPNSLPEASDTILELGDFDPTLQGIRVYPQCDPKLQYQRQEGFRPGSLVVLTNKNAGVGGLPFHVQSQARDESVFHSGMIIEIPMSFNVPFMPSREEIKYTDEMVALLYRIDAASVEAVLSRVSELYQAKSLGSKALLTKLLGSTQVWHWFARAARNNSDLHVKLASLTGGVWRGEMVIPLDRVFSTKPSLTFRVMVGSGSLRYGFEQQGALYLSAGLTKPNYPVTFNPLKPVRVIYNDIPTGGVSRFRAWVAKLSPKDADKFVFIDSDVMGESKEAADIINGTFGNELEVYSTSSMDALPRKIVGSRVISRSASGSKITYYSTAQGRQETISMSFTDPLRFTGEKRFWLEKNGVVLNGFKPSSSMSDLNPTYGDGSLVPVLKGMKTDQLYLLTSKQVKNLESAKAALISDGLWDMDEDLVEDDDESQEILHQVLALKSWLPLEDGLATLCSSPAVQATNNGFNPVFVVEDGPFRRLCTRIGEKPRMQLSGTKFDEAISSYLDTLTGELKLNMVTDWDHKQLCYGLTLIGGHLQEMDTDSDERKDLIIFLRNLVTAGTVNYTEIRKELITRFPLINALEAIQQANSECLDHVCTALAALYR